MTSMINKSLFIVVIACITLGLASCGVYSFTNASIPPDIKTISIGYLDNKARYINPQLSPKLTDALVQKINNQTKLTRVENEGDYQITGHITTYNVGTSGISAQKASMNRLTVGVHITLNKKTKSKEGSGYEYVKQDFDISRDFDFDASLSLNSAEERLMPDILSNVSDEIFNKIFSNW